MFWSLEDYLQVDITHVRILLLVKDIKIYYIVNVVTQLKVALKSISAKMRSKILKLWY
jgi:hypothetical protein